ncbi:hypothetical protein HDE_05939 [Halotydeus destructor]|nr:hypothetical protein HDE_05939 [Halotydeus destructor]
MMEAMDDPKLKQEVRVTLHRLTAQQISSYLNHRTPKSSVSNYRGRKNSDAKRNKRGQYSLEENPYSYSQARSIRKHYREVTNVDDSILRSVVTDEIRNMFKNKSKHSGEFMLEETRMEVLRMVFRAREWIVENPDFGSRIHILQKRDVNNCTTAILKLSPNCSKNVAQPIGKDVTYYVVSGHVRFHVNGLAHRDVHVNRELVVPANTTYNLKNEDATDQAILYFEVRHQDVQELKSFENHSL